MADIADEAQRHIEAETEAALARLRRPAVMVPVADRVCRACADWIGMDRLTAVPDTVHCIWCANALEQRQRQGRA